MADVPEKFRYTKEHEWVEDLTGSRFRIGITDFAQSALGDIVYVQPPKVGDSTQAGRVCGEVESTKSVSEIFAPLTGVIVAVNSDLDTNPAAINLDPYGSGWILEIEIQESAQLGGLLSAAEYMKFTA